MHRITQLAAGALAALALGAPATAQADSILYLRGNDLWLSTPDGARQHQVTRTGTYNYGTQADDGTIVALTADRRLQRIDRTTGAVTADFATPVSDTPPNSNFIFEGPYSPTISPDGKKVAYGYAARYLRYDPNCGYPGGCSEGKLIVGTGYSHADRLTAWDEPGFRNHSGWRWPSWMGNDHVVISQPAEIQNHEIWVDTFGDDANGRPWLGFTVGWDGSDYDAEVNAQSSAMVSISSGGKFLNVDRMGGPWPDGSVERCQFVGNREGPTYSAPSFSPDGTRIAYDDGASVQIIAPDFAGCGDADPTPTRLDAGQYPDWGPADVPAAVAPPPPPPTPAPRGPRAPAVPRAPVERTACGSCGRPSKGGAALAPKVTRASLVRGIALRVTVPSAGRLAAVAKVRGAVVGRARARAVRRGGATLALRFTRAARRKLRANPGAKVALRVTFTPRGGGRAVHSTLTTTLAGARR